MVDVADNTRKDVYNSDDEDEEFEDLGNYEDINNEEEEWEEEEDSEEEEEEEEEIPIEEQADMFKSEGNEFYKKKDYFAAIKKYDEAIKLMPKEHKYYGNRAAASLMLGLYERVVKDCEIAIELNKDFLKAYLRLAKAHLSLGNFDKAEENLTQLYLRDVRSTDVPNERTKIKLSKARLEKARSNLNEGKYAHALSYLHSAQEHCAASKDLKQMKAEALVGTGKYDEAYALTTSLLRNDSKDAKALFWRAKAQYYRGEFEKAIQVMKNIMRMDPDNKECMIEIRKMRKLENMKTEGNDCFKKRKWADAITTYSDCLNIDPQNKLFNAKLLCNRAACLTYLKKYQDAIKDCTQAIDYQKDYVKAYMRRAQCYKSIGTVESLEEALRDYQQAQQMLGEESSAGRDCERSIRDTKLQLKKAKRKDYYKLLGVSERATEEQIKKAYKKAALKYHPDRQASKTEQEKAIATQMFKDCAEGLEILSDPSKRRMYDQGMDLEEINQGGRSGGFGHGHGGMGGIDPNIIFQMFGGGGGGMGGMGGGGRRRSPFM